MGVLMQTDVNSQPECMPSGSSAAGSSRKLSMSVLYQGEGRKRPSERAEGGLGGMSFVRRRTRAAEENGGLVKV